jgi:uncharacterized glyoxalase superfamily protein PhnB
MCVMLMNRSIPTATVLPEIAYPDVIEAAAWLCDAFGFRVRLRIADHRIQMHVGAGAIVLVEREAGATRVSSTMVRVEEIDRHYERAVQRGATIVRPLEDHPYGERQYGVEDFAGNRWKFSQSIADVDPAAWGGVLESLD